MFSSRKTKSMVGRKFCYTRTSDVAPNLPLSSLSVRFKVASQGNICLGWLGPGHVGGHKYLVLNVTAPVSSGHVTPGTGDGGQAVPWEPTSGRDSVG